MLHVSDQHQGTADGGEQEHQPGGWTTPWSSCSATSSAAPPSAPSLVVTCRRRH